MKGKESTNYLQMNYFRTIVFLLIIGIALFASRDQIFDATNEEDNENTTVEKGEQDETGEEEDEQEEDNVVTIYSWKENSALVEENEKSWSYAQPYLIDFGFYIFTKESRVPTNDGSLRINIELPTLESLDETGSVFSEIDFYDDDGDALGTVEHTFSSSSLTIDLVERGVEDAQTVKFNLFYINPLGVFGLDSEGYGTFKSSTTFEYLVLE